MAACGKMWTLGLGQANWNCLHTQVDFQKSSPLLTNPWCAKVSPPRPGPAPYHSVEENKAILLNCYLYGGPKLLVAEAAHECPPTAGDVRHLCDGLHLLGAANAYLEIQKSKMRMKQFIRILTQDLRTVPGPTSGLAAGEPRAQPHVTPACQSIKTHLWVSTPFKCLMAKTPVLL